MGNTASLTYEHIEQGVDGVPFVAGTTMKVVELVMAQTAYGWSPEELHFHIRAWFRKWSGHLYN